MLLFTIDEEGQGETALRHILGYQVDAVLAFATLSLQFIELCDAKGITLVAYNRAVADERVATIDAEHRLGAWTVADLLIEAGHRRLAMVAGPGANPVAELRRKGFLARRAQVGGAEVPVEGGDFTYESGYRAALALMASRSPPDGLFCANDIMALGAMDALRFGLKLAVPGDVSVVGCDDTRGGQRATYDLTTLAQPADQMVTCAADLIEAQLEGVRPAAKEVAPVTLRVRGSARLPARLARGDYDVRRLAADALTPYAA